MPHIGPTRKNGRTTQLESFSMKNPILLTTLVILFWIGCWSFRHETDHEKQIDSLNKYIIDMVR